MLRRSTSSGSNNEEKKDEKVNTSNLVAAGHDNFDMIFMMLMGIRTATGKFANLPARDLTAADFDQKWDGDFLKGGSPDTPAHGNNDFRFRDFSPLVFRQIRERFGVMTEDYLLTNVAVDLEARAPAIARQLETLTGRPASHDAVVAFMGVEPAYLEAAWAAIDDRYGSADAYLSQALGVDATLRDRIGARLSA